MSIRPKPPRFFDQWVEINSYEYDYLSRRTLAITTIDAPQGAKATAYLYDGWNVVAEYEASTPANPVRLTTHTWGLDLSGSMQGAGGVGGLLAVTKHGTAIEHFYPTYDGNGNVSEYLDEDGEEVAHYQYDPFGRLIAPTGDWQNFQYRFSTKPQAEETGFYYYGYRWYDPATGRWPSRDPIEETGGLNLYCFIENQSVSDWDILGLCSDGECKIHITGWKDVSIELSITLGSNRVIAIDSPELLGMLDPDLNLEDLEFRDIAGGIRGMLIRKVLAKALLGSIAQSIVKSVGKALDLVSQKVLLTMYTSMSLSIRYDAMYNICRCKNGKWGKWENWWLMSKLDNKRIEISRVNADNVQDGNQIADMTLDGLHASLEGLIEKATLKGVTDHARGEIKIKEGCK